MRAYPWCRGSGFRAGSRSKDRAMRGWRGACTCLVAAALASPAVARGDDGSALVTFKLPNAGAVDTLNRSGADLAESVRPGAGGGAVYVDAIVTPAERA